MDNEKNLRLASVFIAVIGALSVLLALSIIMAGAESINTVGGMPADMGHSGGLSAMFDESRVTNDEGLKMMSAGIAVTGIFTLFVAVFNIIRGVLGIKIAKGGNMYIAALIMGVIALIYDIAQLCMSLTGGLSIIAKVLYLIASAVYVYSVNAIKQEREAAAILEAEENADGEGSDDGSEQTGPDEPAAHIKTIDDEAEEFFK